MTTSSEPRKRGRPRTSSLTVTEAMPALGSKVRYSIEESAHLLGISAAMLWARIAAGQIATIVDGRRRYITDAVLREYGEQSH